MTSYSKPPVIIGSENERKVVIMYKRDDMEYIVEGLVQELIDMKDGSCISTSELADEWVYPSDRFDDLVSEIHNRLMRAARKRGIKFTTPEGYVNATVGLPHNIPYTVHNLSAQEKCPYCGSRNTGRYMYGMPAYSEKLQDKMDRGKVHLAGCGIFLADVGGRSVMTGPMFHCNDCQKDFGEPPLVFLQDQFHAKDLCDITEKITFAVVQERGGSYEMSMERTEDGAAVNSFEMFHPDKHITDKKISQRKWEGLLHKLFYRYHVHEWKKNYHEMNVKDGERRTLSFKLEGDRVRTFKGSNAYPPYWKELNRELRNVIK